MDHFWPLRHRFLPFDHEYLENMSIRAENQLDESFLKNVSYGAVVPPGESIISKDMLHCVSIFTAACMINISTDAR